MLPEAPNITEEDLHRCRESGDFCPVLFEWYKFVGALAVTFACLRRESPALRSIPEDEYAILIGLLNRFARLMLANVALSHEGGFGETTSIIDRSIFESCVILSWLCRTRDIDRFVRYKASGLKTEVELKEQILANVGCAKRRSAGNRKSYAFINRQMHCRFRSDRTRDLRGQEIAGYSIDDQCYRQTSHHVHRGSEDRVASCARHMGQFDDALPREGRGRKHSSP